MHFFQWKKTFHNRGPKNKFIFEDQVPSWSTTLNICLGAMFYKGFNWVQKEGGGSAGGQGSEGIQTLINWVSNFKIWGQKKK